MMEEKFVSVKNLKVIGRGQNGNVYRLSDGLVIKVYNSFVPLENIEHERKNAAVINEMGLPSAKVFDIVNTEEGKGLIYEYIDAVSLQDLMKRNPERMEEYSERLGKLCKAMHSINAGGTITHSAKKEFLHRLKESRELIEELYDSAVYRKIENLISSVPDGKGIVHGDFHPDNILVRDNEFIIIDLADVMIGHPVFDLLSLYFLRVNKEAMFHAIEKNLDSIPNQEDRLQASALIKKQKERTSAFSNTESAEFWKGFSKGYFEGEEQGYIENMTRLIDGFSYLYAAASVRTEGSFGKAVVRVGTQEGVRVLLERYDDLLELISRL